MTKKFTVPLALFKGRIKKSLWLYIMLLVIVSIPRQSFCQSNSTINGFIKDAKTGETLVGATVYISDINQGTTTNTYGYYSLSAQRGVYQISVFYMGYDPVQKEVNLNPDQNQDFLLQPTSFTIGEVVISGKKAAKEHIESTRTGVESLSPTDIKYLPGLAGGNDIIKAFQLSNGIKAGDEGFSNMYVRGGRADQNLVILDEATVYNITHIGGLFSIFNSDAIKNATLVKGAIPSRYGGRLSSLLDIQMKDGNNQKLKGSGAIDILSTKFMLEGPLKKGKSSFMFSGRRSYIDILLAPVMHDNKAYFYDFNLKFNTWIGEKDRLYISSYLGEDVLNITPITKGIDLNWGNKTATVRWNHIYNKKLFSNVSIVYSDFSYYLESFDLIRNGSTDVERAILDGGIEDLSAKIDLEYFITPKFTLKFGGSSIYHRFTTGLVSRVNNKERQPEVFGFESGLYFSCLYQPNIKLVIEGGIRYNNFSIVGPYEKYSPESGTNRIATTHYSNGELIDQFNDLSPSLSAVYLLNESSSIKASISRNNQYIHTLNSFRFNTPLSLWIPSLEDVSPSYANQYSIGYYKNLFGGLWQCSVEAYYKDLYNQKDLKPGTDTFFDNVIDNIVEGVGSAYGIEFSAKKMKGKLTGWFNYTYSRAWYEADELDYGRRYPAFQDRPHDINIALMYKLSKRLNLSVLWVYRSGQPYTLPIAQYEENGVVVPIYSSINGERYMDYHRLDLNFSIYSKKSLTRKFKSYWSFGLYNAYGRNNALLHIYDEKNKPDGLGRNKTINKVSLFKFIPTVSYNFKF
ncbi:MAG: TonB-dependent receptor domain-containing protein [Hyphomicrobiales bacterium]